MTWLRLDTDAARSGVAGDLAKDLGLKPMHAFGHYVATILGFGEHRPDGQLDTVSDFTLENWAHWKGKEGRWATAFRDRCRSDGAGQDPVGVVRGWWRQEALVRKKIRDASRPPSHLRNQEFPQDSRAGNAGEPRAIPPEFPRDSPGGDGGRRTEDGYGNETTPTGLPGRLAEKLTGHPSRYAVMALIEHLPEGQSVNAWSGCLLGCLNGQGLKQGRVATVNELAAACTDYLATPAISWGIPHFRSFVDRIVGKRYHATKGAGGTSRTERAVAAAADFAAGGDPE